MSIVERQIRHALGPRISVGAPATVLRARWTLSLPALLSSSPATSELGAALRRWGGRGPEPTLEWTVEECLDCAVGGTRWTAAAALHGPGIAVPLFDSNGTTRVEITEDPATAMRHAEVRDNGEVLLSAAFDGAGGATLYARTSLLARLGLGGGRYEVVR